MPMMLGKGNQLVRRIRILRRDRAERVRQSVFLAEGMHLCREALASGAGLEHVIYSAGLTATAEGRELLADLRGAGTVLDETSDVILDSLQDTRSSQPVLALVHRKEIAFPDLLATRHRYPLVVVAHAIQDPGNLGAILRTAEASGASGLIATGRSADLHHPRTVRATMGSIFRLPAIHSEELLDVVRRLGNEKFHRVAAETGSGPEPQEIDWNRPTALFLGPERGSLPEASRNLMDSGLSIPMETGVDSLSVGAAAAVILFVARRARDRDHRSPGD